MTQSAPPSELSRQAAQGTFWAYLSFVGGKLLTLVSTIILARLLVPAEFGLMGYCMIAIQYLDILTTFGLDSALIARRDRLPEACNANFLLGIATGAGLYAMTWLVAPLVAMFFNEPQIVPLLRVLALVLPISALGLVPSALLQRELRFRAKLVPDLVRNITKGAVSIGLAYYGAGVWSLVGGQIAGELVTTLLVWPMARWRPTLDFDWQVARESLDFGKHILLIGLVGALVNNIDYLFVGRTLGAAALGFYTLGYRLPELLIRNFNIVVSRVSFPLLARIQQDRERLVQVYLRYIGYVALFTFPVGVGLAAISPALIVALYTEKWSATIPVMQAVALALALSSIGHVPGVLYKATGRPEILNQAAVVKVPFAIVVLYLSTSWGIVGVGIAQIAVAVCNAIVDSVLVRRVIQVSLLQILEAVRPAFISAAAMGLTLQAISVALHPSGIPGVVGMVALGGLIYGGVLFLIDRPTVLTARQMLASLVLRRRGAGA